MHRNEHRRDLGVNASLREATVHPNPDSQEQAEERRKAQAERLNRLPKVKATRVEDIDDQFPQALKAAAPLPLKGK